MSDFTARQSAPFAGTTDSAAWSPPRPSPAAVPYLISLLLVGAAVLAAFVVDQVASAPNLTLIFVLPVVIAGLAFGWGPSLVAVFAGVLAFDFFFTAPYFSFRIASAADMWAAGLLLVIAAMVTTAAATSRRRAMEAARGAEQAQALQAFAHLVIEARPQAEILQAAATALHRAFRAPAVIYLQSGGVARPVAAAGGPHLTRADEDAARGALTDGLHTRAETFPFDQAEFEFWPVITPVGSDYVLGVDFSRAAADRPERPERFVDAVAAYLALAIPAGPAPVAGLRRRPQAPGGGSPKIP
jgi:two-component system sensor histidine kinase KdpD